MARSARARSSRCLVWFADITVANGETLDWKTAPLTEESARGFLPISREDVAAPSRFSMAVTDELMRIAGFVVVESDEPDDPELRRAIAEVGNDRVIHVAEERRSSTNAFVRSPGEDDWDGFGAFDEFAADGELLGTGLLETVMFEMFGCGNALSPTNFDFVPCMSFMKSDQIASG